MPYIDGFVVPVPTAKREEYRAHEAKWWPTFRDMGATAFGVVLAIIAIRTGSIAFASGLHFANNIFAATVLVSAGDAFRNTPGLFTQATPHLMWWDTAVGVLALVAVAWFVTRRAPSA